MKIFLGMIIAAQIFATAGTNEMLSIQEPENVVSEAQGGYELMRVEEFKWYYRTYNGHCQMRLWSVTYGHWVTDWIDCDA